MENTLASTPYAPRPGDIGLTQIGGLLGVFVTLGQWINGDLSPFTHAFIYLGGGEVMEGQPGGARISPLSRYADKYVRYSRWVPLTDEERANIVKVALVMRGTPYSYADYLALALVRLHIRPKRLLDYVASSNHMICSQLVDYVYCKAGVHLFSDGRPSQDVTPGDLDRVLDLEW